MNQCQRMIFSKKILCAGTMDTYLFIKSRQSAGTDIDNLHPTMTFTTVYECMAGFEEVKPTYRFDGITIDSTITHIAYIPFEQSVYELDTNKLFVEKEGQRNRYFKLKPIRDYGEQGEWLVLYLTETGFSDLQASEG